MVAVRSHTQADARAQSERDTQIGGQELLEVEAQGSSQTCL